RARLRMDFSRKHVVVTGGTGALGTSVVGALIGAGATCTVPYVHDAEAERFPYRGQPQATLIKVSDLSEEAEVAKVYAGVRSLWASIHIAGGFAAAKIIDIDKTALMAQIDSNLASCFLCGGASGAGTAERCRHDRLHPRQGRSGGAHDGACRGSCEGWSSGERRRAFDHGHRGQPQGYAEGRPHHLAESGRSRGDDRVPRLAGQPRHPRCHRPGLRKILTRDRHELERRPQQALDGIRRYHGRPFGISLVVLLDVIEIVEIVHHHPIPLRDCTLRGIREPVDALKPRTVAEMETCHWINKSAPCVACSHKIPGRSTHQRVF